jgi:hypothetical protein
MDPFLARTVSGPFLGLFPTVADGSGKNAAKSFPINHTLSRRAMWAVDEVCTVHVTLLIRDDRHHRRFGGDAFSLSP